MLGAKAGLEAISNSGSNIFRLSYAKLMNTFRRSYVVSKNLPECKTIYELVKKVKELEKVVENKIEGKTIDSDTR